MDFNHFENFVLLNKSLRDYQLNYKEWEFHSTAKKIHKWIPLMNRDYFNNKLPYPFITFRKRGFKNLGHFRYFPNHAGAIFEINLNSNFLSRPDINIAETLLHEMCHLWQHISGKSKPSRYHNKAFIELTKRFGIESNNRGITVKISEPFIKWVEENGICSEG